jgi:hypothetical protein
VSTSSGRSISLSTTETCWQVVISEKLLATRIERWLAVRVVASELVSNVVQHTDDGGIVRAWDPKPDKPFRREVADSNVELPDPPEVPPEVGERGLLLVDELSDDWGVDRHDMGKTVWAEFSRPDQPSSRPPDE